MAGALSGGGVLWTIGVPDKISTSKLGFQKAFDSEKKYDNDNRNMCPSKERAPGPQARGPYHAFMHDDRLYKKADTALSQFFLQFAVFDRCIVYFSRQTS